MESSLKTKRKLIDGFYESEFDEDGESIKKRIMDLEYNPKRGAFKELSVELFIIKEELEP
ncbi:MULTISPECIES: hypothetical protein [Paenibacillus]|uniref:hypothetical protein n=1 Tax=Paenibacillus TaxID=44249 RepID=UPI0022B8B03D|nr:hypothetical protein [Paenibacillus caseinilyticus]MCZ8519930.1 hypothetical protein [Paenibacillus caseinilyticus]